MRFPLLGFPSSVAMAAAGLVLCCCCCCLSAALSVNPETERLIGEICGRVEDFQFCNTTLNANLRTGFEGIEQLAELPIVLAVESATKTKGYAEGLAREEKDEDTKFCLELCATAYGVVKDAFTTAKAQFDGGEIPGVNESEKKGVQPVQDCDFVFAAKSPTPGLKNPLRERNAQMSDLVQIALSALQNLLPT